MSTPLYCEASEFTVEILKDLVSQGYSDEELITQIQVYNEQIRKNIGKLIEEGDQIASGKKSGATFEDVFGSEV